MITGEKSSSCTKVLEPNEPVLVLGSLLGWVNIKLKVYLKLFSDL
jgi:hypothetical protein